MATSINLNPMKTSNAAGTFSLQSYGQIQGFAVDEPATRFQLSSGWLDPADALPMWGSVALYVDTIPTSGAAQPDAALGSRVGRSTALIGAKPLNGFSVYNQAHHMIQTPFNNVPLSLAYMSVHYYLFGSRAVIPVKCAQSLIGAAQGALITQAISWDYENSQLIPGLAAWAQIAITSQTRAVDGTVTVLTGAAHPFAAGNVVDLSGAVPAAYNGPKTIITAADNTHFTYAMPIDPGVSPASTPGVVDAGGGILTAKLLKVFPDANSMTIEYDAVTGVASWNRNGYVGLIEI